MDNPLIRSHWVFLYVCVQSGFIALVLLYVLSPFVHAAPGINREIAFQGSLNSALGVPLSGSYDMSFSIYTESSGGVAVWTGTYSAVNGNPVTVTDGTFRVMLGSGTGNALTVDFTEDTYYIGLTVAEDSEMTPRQRIGAAAYAFNADKLDGYDASDFLADTASTSMSTTSATTLFTLNQMGAGNVLDLFNGATSVFTVLSNGHVGIGTSTPAQLLSVAGGMHLTGAFYDGAYNSGTSGMVLQTTGTGVQWVATSSLGFSSSFNSSADLATLLTDEEGSGSVVYSSSPTLSGLLTFATASGTALTTSGNAYFEGNVGIGSSSPSAKLTVVGNISNLASTNFSPVTRATTSIASPWDVYVSGRYAYVVTLGGMLQIYDVSSSTPSEVGSLSVGGAVRAVYVSGRYAYLANYTSNTFQIVDIANPSSPVLVSTISTGASTNPSDVYVSGRYAYVTLYNGNGLFIYDISNPLSPIRVGSVGSMQGADSVFVSGSYAYVVPSAGFGARLYIIDISNPASPSAVGNISTGGSNLTDVFVSGMYAYVVDPNSNLLRIYNVARPSAPVSVASVSTASDPRAVFVSGRYAYVASNGGSTLQVFDVLNPTNVYAAGSVSSNGSMSVFVAGRFAYLANNGNSTLQVVELPGLETSSAIAHSLEAGNLQVRNNVVIQGGALIAGALNVGSGGIYSNGPIAAYVASSTQTGAISGFFEGRVGIGTTSPSRHLTVVGDIYGLNNLTVASSTLGFASSTAFTSTGNAYLGGSVGIGTTTPSSKLTVDGTIQATNLLGGAVNLTTDASGNIIRDPSDERLKEMIADIEDPLIKLVSLRGVTYEWKDKARFGNQKEMGFIAQEVDLVVPEVVRKGGEYWSLNTRNLLAVVVEAVKELYDQVQVYFTRTEQLEAQNAALEARVRSLEEAAGIEAVQEAGGTSEPRVEETPAVVSGADETTQPEAPAENPEVVSEGIPAEVVTSEETVAEQPVPEETGEVPISAEPTAVTEL